MNKKSLRTGVLNTPYVIWSALFIIIPLIVTVLLCISSTHENDNDSKKN